MHDLDTILNTLASQAQPCGGWGYGPDQEAHLEPTCLALLALSHDAERYRDAIDRGRRVLNDCSTGDGVYRLPRGRDEAVWPTALVLFVQTTLDYPAGEIQKTAARLLELRGQVPEDSQAAEMHDIDVKLVGWPWGAGNFAWAEPTAWACLALRRAGYATHPRVQEGMKLLLDRAADGGGINYGNRRIFGRLTEPLPGPTALMLLALQGHADRPRVAAAVTYLLTRGTEGDDLEHLCWAKLALDHYRDRPDVAAAFPTLDNRLRAAHESRATVPWLKPSPHREALTALALATEKRNFFRLNEVVVPAPQHSALSTQHSALAKHSPKKRPLPERLRSAFRSLAVEAVGRLRPVAPAASVHIAPVTAYDEDLADIVCRQYQDFAEKVPLKGKRVVLKPNLVEYHRDKVINTHPHVVAAVIELCRREEAAEVIVAEGPGHCRNVEYLVQASGLGDVLRHYQVPFVDLNHDEPVKTLNLGRLTGLEYLYLARTVVSADVLISLPKLKTHHWAGATLSLKNLFGTLPGICYGWPKNELHWRGINHSIVDIALTRPPDLAIVDGIVGMEGDGPLNGTPKPLGAIIMGTDLVAVDATCCRLMQLNPEQVGYLLLGAQKRLGLLGAGAIRQVGERIDTLAQPFETLPEFQKLHLGRSA